MRGREAFAGPPEEALERIAGVCARFGIEPLRPRIAACEEALRAGGVVDVAVLGRFKAGKSSFLNSLIGRELLPVDVLPSTSVVARIAGGPTDRVAVRFLSGGVQEIPAERLSEFATEQGNPANGKRVAGVEVELSSLQAYRGIRFVDTPGLGSIHAQNTQAAMEWLPRVGAALVAMSINHPFSEEDLALLSEVSRHTPEVAILLTKADLVTESQRDAVLDFTRRQAIGHTGRELPVFPYSDRAGSEGLRSALRDYLVDRIAGRREESFREIVAHKVGSLSASCREYLQLAERAALERETARDGLRALLAREKSDVGVVAGEIRVVAESIKNCVRETSWEGFKGYGPRVARRMEAALAAEMRGWKGHLGTRTRLYEAWLERATRAELSAVSERGEGHLDGQLLRAHASVSRAVRAFQDRLSKEIERALGIPFSGAHFEACTAKPRAPDVRVSPTFDTHVDLLWFLIPVPLVRPLIERHFSRAIPWHVEKNLARLSAQWTDAVNASIDDLARQGRDYLAAEISTIERILSPAGGERLEEIRESLASLPTASS